MKLNKKTKEKQLYVSVEEFLFLLTFKGNGAIFTKGMIDRQMTDGYRYMYAKWGKTVTKTHKIYDSICVNLNLQGQEVD